MNINPIFQQHLRFTYAHFSHKKSIIHGLPHWQNVWHNAIYLSEKESIDPLVPQLFAISHDFQRLNDSIDPQHGPRAARLLKQNKLLQEMLTPQQHKDLLYACQTHTGGNRAPNLVVGVCWDSDRLDITRVGKMLDVQYLTTETAKDIAVSFAAEDEWLAYRRELPSIYNLL